MCVLNDSIYIQKLAIINKESKYTTQWCDHVHNAHFVDFLCVGYHTQPLYICPGHLNISACTEIVDLMCLQIIFFKWKEILTET